MVPILLLAETRLSFPSLGLDDFEAAPPWDARGSLERQVCSGHSQ